MQMRKILIKNWMVEARVGIHAHEKTRPQPVRINLVCYEEDKPPFRGKKITEVVCYEKLRKRVLDVVGQQHDNLIETLADKIAAACLEDKRMLRVMVCIEKPGIFPDLESCGIEIERKQGDY